MLLCVGLCVCCVLVVCVVVCVQDEEIPTDAKLAFFNETRHAYGRSALLLSGGAYLGYYHMGVVKVRLSNRPLSRPLSSPLSRPLSTWATTTWAW